MNSKGLPTGYQIHNYRIEKVLGEGGFGITYKAVDLNLNRPVAIKEFMPMGFALRSDDGDVEPSHPDNEKTYQDGLISFVKEAQALARFEHKNIVRVYTFLRHHKTAYIIMEYVEGMTFSEWLRQHPNPAEAELIAIASPILDGLHELHKAGLLHRDIKPGNIYICRDNRPILLDFGAVGDLQPSDATKELSVVKLTEGYAPPEQYGKSGQGPWTDIYALGACLYLSVTGKTVTNAMERTTEVFGGKEDPQPRLSQTALLSNYSNHFLDAIENAIALNPQDRIESALKFRNRLENIQSSNTREMIENTRQRQRNEGKDDSADRVVRGDGGNLAVTTVSPRLDSAQADVPTRIRNSASEASGSAPLSAATNTAQIQSISPAKAANPEKTGHGKTIIILMTIAGISILAWVAKNQFVNDQVPDGFIANAKEQIDELNAISNEMKLPETGDYTAAVSNLQLAAEIESNKTEGGSAEIKDNLMDAISLLKSHITTEGPVQLTALVDTVAGKLEKAKQLGVGDLLSIELPELSDIETDPESLRNEYGNLSAVLKELDIDIRKNTRLYVIGSSAEDIEDALEQCKQYSPDCSLEWYEDELAREVELSPFELDKSEITLAEFGLYAASTGVETSAEKQGYSYVIDSTKNFAVTPRDGVYWKNAYDANIDIEGQPVIHVSRQDAIGYCNHIGKRLPTEAEWESAARGPNRFKYPSGDSWDGAQVNWGGSPDSMMPTKSFPANDKGFFDLAGSVTEWTSSDLDEENTGILKGGSRYDTNVANLRLSVRRLETIDYTGEDVGFRCAKTLDEWPDS